MEHLRAEYCIRKVEFFLKTMTTMHEIFLFQLSVLQAQTSLMLLPLLWQFYCSFQSCSFQLYLKSTNILLLVVLLLGQQNVDLFFRATTVICPAPCPNQKSEMKISKAWIASQHLNMCCITANIYIQGNQKYLIRNRT